MFPSEYLKDPEKSIPNTFKSQASDIFARDFDLDVDPEPESSPKSVAEKVNFLSLIFPNICKVSNSSKI